MTRPYRPNTGEPMQPGETRDAYRARRRATHVKQETRSEAKARKRREAEQRSPGHTKSKAQRAREVA